jgi:putative transcriptional regulator
MIGLNPSPEEIRAARKLAGLTQDSAAKLVFSNTRSWQRWESGERKMHLAIWELFNLKSKQGLYVVFIEDEDEDEDEEY